MYVPHSFPDVPLLQLLPLLLPLQSTELEWTGRHAQLLQSLCVGFVIHLLSSVSIFFFSREQPSGWLTSEREKASKVSCGQKIHLFFIVIQFDRKVNHILSEVCNIQKIHIHALQTVFYSGLLHVFTTYLTHCSVCRYRVAVIQYNTIHVCFISFRFMRVFPFLLLLLRPLFTVYCFFH